MIVDEVMPVAEYRVRVRSAVRADLETTWAAVHEANLFADPWVRGLFAIRDLPTRLWHRLRGQPAESVPRSITFRDIAEMPNWVVLGEDPPRETVLGSVGRFWQHDYGIREVAPSEFAGFAETGYAKTVAAIRLERLVDGRTLMTYESRTTTTSAEARRRFRLYWVVLRFGIWLVMKRSLAAIRAEAEGSSTLLGSAKRGSS
jgi:hypothetical protein